MIPDQFEAPSDIRRRGGVLVCGRREHSALKTFGNPDQSHQTRVPASSRCRFPHRATELRHQMIRFSQRTNDDASDCIAPFRRLEIREAVNPIFDDRELTST
jgi:hypothetical protein